MAGSYRELSTILPSSLMLGNRQLAYPLLRPEDRSAALEELERKCRIYAQGCRKRGRAEEAELYTGLAERYKRET